MLVDTEIHLKSWLDKNQKTCLEPHQYERYIDDQYGELCGNPPLLDEMERKAKIDSALAATVSFYDFRKRLSKAKLLSDRGRKFAFINHHDSPATGLKLWQAWFLGPSERRFNTDRAADWVRACSPNYSRGDMTAKDYGNVTMVYKTMNGASDGFYHICPMKNERIDFFHNGAIEFGVSEDASDTPV
ncbi:MAG: hypothetical protein Q9222_007298 [Ikaeria aurantiellina]